MKIGIIGLGVVGTAIQQAFSTDNKTVIGFDIKNPEQSFNDVINTDCVFVCVPTNLNEQGECDLTKVDLVLKQLSDNEYTGVVIIKSTVIPGSTDQFSRNYPLLEICFVPEFLRQAHAFDDFISSQETLIVGTYNQSTADFLGTLHKSFSKTVLKIGPTEAELAKYFSNCINALHVTFANAVFEMSQHLNIDYDNVLAAAVTRPNIATRSYLECNGKNRGFAGNCLPKDLQAFTSFVRSIRPEITLFDSITKDNKFYRE